MKTKINLHVPYSVARKRNLGAALLLVLLVATLAHAQLTPSDDAYVNSAAPTINYGAATTLDLSSAADTAFIRFDLTAVPAGTPGSSIAKATLKLYVNSVTTAGSFNVDYVTGTWSEKTITHSLQPAVGTTIAASVPLATASKSKYVEIDVTAAMVEWLNGTQANDGIALVANSPLVATFDSKENTTTSHAPELDLVFTSGGITGVTTASGSGLMGGGTSGTLKLSLTNTCAANQVLQWNGTAWACANLKGSGTITGVTAGTDLTGGGTSGVVTLNLNTTKVPLLAANNPFMGNNSFAGSVGVGTMTPTHMFEVDALGASAAQMAMVSTGSDAAISLNNTAAGGREYWIDSGSGVAGAGAGNFAVWDNTAHAARLAVNEFGNVGVGTTNPYTLLHLVQSNSGGLGPSITLTNSGGGAGAGASIDFNGYEPTVANPPTARIQSIDDGSDSSSLTFQTKTPGSVSNGLVEQVRISDYGSLIVDSSHNNTGSLNSGATAGTGLVFGGAGSGEGIASCRSTGCTDPNGYSEQYSLDFYTNGTLRMTIFNDGFVQAYGDLDVSGCTYWGNGNNQGSCVSDARLKTNIQPFPRLLDKLVQLEPVHFDWSPSVPPELHRSGTHQTGFVAQQVEKVFPEMVTMGKDGYRRVNYGQLPYLLLEGVRELKASNDSLSAETQRQRKQSEQARAEIAKLRRAMASTDARVTKLGRSAAAKDAKIAVLSREIEQLREAQQQMAVLLARFAPPQDEHGKQQVAEARPAVKAPAARVTKTAQTQF
ncbi:MAG TPA: DNRLRE domain-containing protein [Terriglobales bacterium]|nr:DNRLRE domain-containing protein [Terriglobales bacterium]